MKYGSPICNTARGRVGRQPPWRSFAYLLLITWNALRSFSILYFWKRQEDRIIAWIVLLRAAPRPNMITIKGPGVVNYAPGVIGPACKVILIPPFFCAYAVLSIV